MNKTCKALYSLAFQFNDITNTMYVFHRDDWNAYWGSVPNQWEIIGIKAEKGNLLATEELFSLAEIYVRRNGIKRRSNASVRKTRIVKFRRSIY